MVMIVRRYTEEVNMILFDMVAAVVSTEYVVTAREGFSE